MAKHITLLLILAVAPLLQSNSLQVDLSFNFEQMKEDAERIEASEYSYNFDFQNPKHKYFVVINALDVATTIYALENRTSLVEGNRLLSERPKPEELLAQKIIVSYALERLGMFDNTVMANESLSLTNFLVTLAVLNNYYLINKYD